MIFLNPPTTAAPHNTPTLPPNPGKLFFLAVSNLINKEAQFNIVRSISTILVRHFLVPRKHLAYREKLKKFGSELLLFITSPSSFIYNVCPIYVVLFGYISLRQFSWVFSISFFYFDRFDKCFVKKRKSGNNFLHKH